MQRAAAATAEVTSINFFVVFPLDVLLLLLASIGIIELIEWGVKKQRSGRQTPTSLPLKILLNTLDLLRVALFSFAIVFAVQEWSGHYNGNNLLSIPIEGTSFLNVLLLCRQGKWNLVVDPSASILSPNETVSLFGSNTSFVFATSLRERFEAVCKQSARVGLFQELELYEFLADEELSSSCDLIENKLGLGESTSMDFLDQSMLAGKPFTFLIGKSGTRAMREAMDIALMSVYSEENVNSLLNFKFMPIKMRIAVGRQTVDTSPALTAAPLSLTHLSIPMSFLALGLLAALLGFITEWITFVARGGGRGPCGRRRCDCS